MKYNRKIIYLAGFLFSLPIALTSYINSSALLVHIDEFILSIVYILASILTIIGMLKMPRILEHLGNRSTTLLFCILFFISLIILAFGGNKIILVLSFILYFISSNFIITSLDIFIEDFSQNSKVGSIRGIYLAVISLGWVVAQMVSGSIILKSSFRGIYLLSAGFVVLVYVIFTVFLRDFQDPQYKKISIRKTLKLFVQNKHLSKIYLINLVLKFFYVWMVIYMPIYLHGHLGFGWDKIGIIFSIMLIPFVILDFPLGRLSDKIGEKKMLVVGFAIMGLSTALIPLLQTSLLWLWATVLFFTRVGAATVETMSESYFFKYVNEENSDAISFFRNTTPLSYVLGPALAIPVLLYTPSFQYLFYVLSAVLLLGLFITLRLRDVR